MKTSSNWYVLLAAIGLLAMFWLFDIVQQPGTQWLAAIGMGVVATATVRCIVRAARVDQTETVRVVVRDGRP